MSNERVNKLLNATLAGKITKQLSKKEKNQTDVIKADVWNAFVQKIGTGKEIKNSITLENAMNSITKYAVSEGNKQNKSANEVAKEWYNLMGLELETKNAEEAKPAVPVEETKAEQNQSPQAEEVADEFIDCIVERVKNEYDPESKALLKSTYYAPDSETVTAIEEFSPKTGKIVKTTSYRKDGTVEFVNDNDEEGKWIRQTSYRQDGTIEKINEYDPEITGEIVFTTHYKEDGKTVDYVD